MQPSRAMMPLCSRYAAAVIRHQSCPRVSALPIPSPTSACSLPQALLNAHGRFCSIFMGAVGALAVSTVVPASVQPWRLRPTAVWLRLTIHLLLLPLSPRLLPTVSRLSPTFVPMLPSGDAILPASLWVVTVRAETWLLLQPSPCLV